MCAACVCVPFTTLHHILACSFSCRWKNEPEQENRAKQKKKIIQGKLFTTFLSFIDDGNGTVLTSFLFKWCP